MNDFLKKKRIISFLTLHKECYKVGETLTVLVGDEDNISVISHPPHYCDAEDPRVDTKYPSNKISTKKGIKLDERHLLIWIKRYQIIINYISPLPC